MTAVENKQRSFVQQPISPSIHRTTSLSTRRRELNPAGLSSTSNESTSAFSSASSLRSSHFISSEQPIQEQCLSPSYRSLYVANSSIQPGPGSRHYVNMCQDSLPPHQFQARSSSRENSVSDSEISTSSAASASALSESSEIRALFPAVYKQNPRMSPTQDHCYNQLKVRPGSKMSERTRQILYRPQHFESDSSSSLAESGDSLNTQDCKHREREHYNKLKLNLDNIAGNKRAIMGKLCACPCTLCVSRHVVYIYTCTYPLYIITGVLSVFDHPYSVCLCRLFMYTHGYIHYQTV